MEDADPGSDKAARYCRSAIYGSVLSGGLGGQIYGAGGWDGGIWSGEVEDASKDPIWEAITWASAEQMQTCRDFILSEGAVYQTLVPATEMLAPNRTGDPKTNDGWAYCAATSDHTLIFVYFEIACPRADLSGVTPNAAYQVQWFDPRTGLWIDETSVATADSAGTLRLPTFPSGEETSSMDWAAKLTRVEGN
jgi:hypothetical protein